MIKRTDQIKKKLTAPPKNIVQFNRACLKPSLFQFPQLMTRTTGAMPAISIEQIRSTNATNTRGKSNITTINKVPQPSIQRFSAKIVSKQNTKEPIIVKITTNKFNSSQVIRQQEEQSEYQLSELESQDELLHQIQEKIIQKNQDIALLSKELCLLESSDLRSIQNISQLIKHLILTSVQQQLFSKQIFAVLLTINEEILTRDDLDSSLIKLIAAYIKNCSQETIPLILQFIKRSGQMIYYIKADRIQLFSEQIIQILLLFNQDIEYDKEILKFGINILLRNRQIRECLKNQNLIKDIKNPLILQQLELFKFYN